MKRFYVLAAVLTTLLCVTCQKKELGHLAVTLRSEAGSYEEFNIEIKSIEALIKQGNSQAWIKLMSNSGEYDLRQFKEAPLLLVPTTQVPLGEICFIKLKIAKMNVKEKGHYYTLQQGDSNAGDLEIMVHAGFAISHSRNMTIIMDIDLNRSGQGPGKHDYLLSPTAICGLVDSPYDIY